MRQQQQGRLAVDDGGGGAAATTTTGPLVLTKTLGPGVTADSIKLGISLIDFKCIQHFIDFTRPNQQAIYQAFVDDVNKKGGINGRKIVPDFNTECPLTATSDLLVQVCTHFTDDDKVFAVIGNLSDAAQSAAMHDVHRQAAQDARRDLPGDPGDVRPDTTGDAHLPGDDARAFVGRALRAVAEAGRARRQEARRARAADLAGRR